MAIKKLTQSVNSEHNCELVGVLVIQYNTLHRYCPVLRVQNYTWLWAYLGVVLCVQPPMNPFLL